MNVLIYEVTPDYIKVNWHHATMQYAHNGILAKTFTFPNISKMWQRRHFM